jgi:hypothetical protein
LCFADNQVNFFGQSVSKPLFIFKAIQKLMAIDPGVKGIVSSGYSDDPGITGYEQHGFKGVAAKPYTREELGEKLSGVLLGTPM